jgi:hypothetical protein
VHTFGVYYDHAGGGVQGTLLGISAALGIAQGPEGIWGSDILTATALSGAERFDRIWGGTAATAGTGAGIGLGLSRIPFIKSRLTAVAGPVRQGSAVSLTDRLEANAARRLAEVQADAGPKSHFFSRHGAQTGLEQQYDRATTGLTPDGFAGPKVDSGRFLSHRAQLNAVQAAQEIYLRTGKKVFTFDAGYVIGEGFLKDAIALVRTTNVRVVFNASGKIKTLFPWLSPLP